MLLLRCAQQMRPLSTQLTGPSRLRLRVKWKALTCRSISLIVRPFATKPTSKSPTKPTTKPAIKANNSPSLPSRSPTGKPSLFPPPLLKAVRANP